jgi:hypothetical protein
MEPDPIVEAVVSTYLDAVDDEAPGVIEGLYLIGSAVMGDFRRHTSDIDFVAVTANRPDEVVLAGLRRAHARVRTRWPRPFFDGLYVSWDDLARDPATAASLPHSHEGQFHGAGADGEPVTWHTLARHGRACRGPRPADVETFLDEHALAAWVLNNLDDYWSRLLRRASSLRTAWGLAAMSPYVTVWVVLGMSRLHYTLATGDICSKEAAGRYALAAFPRRWDRVVNESLRIRRSDRATPDLAGAVAGLREFLPIRERSLYSTPLARRRDILAFGDMVLQDAHRRCGQAVAPG